MFNQRIVRFGVSKSQADESRLRQLIFTFVLSITLAFITFTVSSRSLAQANGDGRGMKTDETAVTVPNQAQINVMIEANAKAYVESMNPRLGRAASLQTEFDTGIVSLREACGPMLTDKAPSMQPQLAASAERRVAERKAQIKLLSEKAESLKQFLDAQTNRFCQALLRTTKRSELICQNGPKLSRFERLVHESLSTQNALLVKRETSLQEIRLVSACLSPSRQMALENLLHQEIDSLDGSIELEIAAGLETLDRIAQFLK